MKSPFPPLSPPLPPFLEFGFRPPLSEISGSAPDSIFFLGGCVIVMSQCFVTVSQSMTLQQCLGELC